MCKLSEICFLRNIAVKVKHRHAKRAGVIFQLIRLLGVRLGVSPVGMVELFMHVASLTT